MPISATLWDDGRLSLRLSGAAAAVTAAAAKLGGDSLPADEAERLWRSVREQTHPFFGSAGVLWRLSPPLELTGRQLIEWGGALRWLIIHTDAEADQEDSMERAIRNAAQKAGGHATLFRSDRPSMAVFHPLSPAMMAINRRLKEKFDPMHLFNPGRMYPGI